MEQVEQENSAEQDSHGRQRAGIDTQTTADGSDNRCGQPIGTE